MNKLNSTAFYCGFLFALCACVPSQLRAQAAPGPLAPKEPTQTRSAPPPDPAPRAIPTEPAAPREKPAPRQNISGSWKLNRDASDDGRNKIEQAQRIDQRNQGNGPMGPNGPMGGNGPYGGGPMGRGYPYPGGGNGPYGGGPNGPNGPNGGNRGIYDEDSDARSPAMREYVYPATEITFSLQNSEVDLTDDAARKRVFFTDGRKLQKSKDDNYREIAAHWEGTRLVAEENVPQGGKLRRTFDLSSDGRQVDEYINLESTRNRSSVSIHYAYDIDPNRQ